MSEIEKKATQIAQESVINVQPFDFASIEYGAIKMGYWMKERMIEKAVQYLQSVPHSKPVFWSIDDFRKYMEESL